MAHRKRRVSKASGSEDAARSVEVVRQTRLDAGSAGKVEFGTGDRSMDLVQPWWKREGSPSRSVAYVVDGEDVSILRLFEVLLISDEAASMRALCIGWVFTRPEYRNLGIATRLCQCVIDALDMHDVTKWASEDVAVHRAALLGNRWQVVQALILYSRTGGLYRDKLQFVSLCDAHGGLWARSMIPGIILMPRSSWRVYPEDHL